MSYLNIFLKLNKKRLANFPLSSAHYHEVMKSAFIEAVKNQDVIQVKTLLEKNPPYIHERDEAGYLGIAWAALLGNLEIFQMLLDAGSNLLDINNENKANLLHLAAQGRNSNIVKIIINKNIITDIDQPTKEGWTAMKLAIATKSEEIVALLKAAESRTNPEDFFLKRQLAFVFGKTLETAKISAHFQDIPKGGNFRHDTLFLIIATLKPFIKKQKLNDRKYNVLITALEFFAQNQEINASVLSKKTPILLETGYGEHYIPAYLEPCADNNWRLTIYERGNFNSLMISKSSDKYFNKFPTAAQIIVPSEKIFFVIEKLKIASEADEEVAEKILFTEIPLELGQSYSIVTVPLQKLATEDNCFYANFQTFMAHQFVKMEGYLIGVELYKKWDLFLHKFTLEAYREYSDLESQVAAKDSADFISASCEEVLDAKKEKLEILKETLTIPDLKDTWKIIIADETTIALKLEDLSICFKKMPKNNNWLLEICTKKTTLSGPISAIKDINLVFWNLKQKNINEVIKKLLSGSYEEQKIAHSIKSEIINFQKEKFQDLTKAVNIINEPSHNQDNFLEDSDNETEVLYSMNRLGS